MGVTATTYLTLFLTGLTGSLAHCAGMCGPLVLMVGSQGSARTMPRLGAFAAYHAARIAVYLLLGALVGLLGGFAGLRGPLGWVAAAVSLVLGVLLLLWGLSYLGAPLLRLELPARWLSQAIARTLRAGGARGVPLLGALNGLLPCGLVYSALVMASSTGQVGAGALGMALFGLGTAPVMLLIGMGAAAFRGRVRQTMAYVTGALLLLVGAQLVLRGLAAAGVIGHLHLGMVMLW